MVLEIKALTIEKTCNFLCTLEEVLHVLEYRHPDHLHLIYVVLIENYAFFVLHFVLVLRSPDLEPQFFQPICVGVLQ